MADNEQTAAQEGQQQFSIQKVYLKDCSLETPNSPDVFRSEWRPEANVELDTSNREIGDGTYEIAIRITVTAKLGDQTAYLCEVEQAGVFAVAGFDGQTLRGLLGSFCPSILFPYAREAISDLTGKAGFPPMVLAPVNFDALYAQQQAQSDGENQQARH
ncbi:Protein-export protein SecB [wastewater metagenome]|uniref:Protein-export protein SecB n=2 Tax=unclassified sequences TaxID=12908 RepID=A0A5B8RD05_9ZZZZ|nr:MULTISPECIES: protein-export chaperone SecB [Arhodomonas]MCS4505397.1 protein-export chaperone SecB [Arhodomonas aquaeolei]QEA06919.1 protein-export protein SecB [uncultured organism]